jgi:hypothetical protein
MRLIKKANCKSTPFWGDSTQKKGFFSALQLA